MKIDISLSISIAAFVITLVTTANTTYRTYRQDIEARRQAFRDALAKIGNLQIQNVDYLSKYKGDPAVVDISSALYAQSVTLTRQAQALSKSLRGRMDATDLIGLADALTQIQEFAAAEEALEQAVSKARNNVDLIAALRTLGRLKYNNGAVEGARQSFERALNGFSKHPAKTDFYLNYTHLQTEVFWAATAAIADREIARRRVAEARNYLAKLDGQAPAALIARLDAIAAQISRETPSAGEPPAATGPIAS